MRVWVHCPPPEGIEKAAKRELTAEFGGVRSNRPALRLPFLATSLSLGRAAVDGNQCRGRHPGTTKQGTTVYLTKLTAEASGINNVIGGIALPLPHPVPATTWRMVTPELRATKTYYPALLKAFEDGRDKTVQMGGKMMAIDYCASHRDGSFHSYKTTIIDDHPFLKTLPPNAPRAVRHPYLAATRMRYLRATDGWGFSGDMGRADAAAWAFNEALICNKNSAR